ncbi:MAG: ABC transporter ATP-binding protein/permease [Candidatus Margulisiibacteriota bacterium]
MLIDRFAKTPAERRFWKAIARYLWPPHRVDLRWRVVISFSFLIGAKLLNIAIPFFYKGAIDLLSRPAALLAVPFAMIAAYCGARITMQLLSELRDVLFSSVTQYAIRTASRRTFEHLHKLSLRFHLERKTGSVSRAIERGAEGINYILSFMLFNILPTILEITLVCGILFSKYPPSFALITLATIGGYIVFTLFVSDWRNHHRRRMNEAESTASAKAVDSLLNYETVKYFGAEDHEVQRFDISLAHFEKASITAQHSLVLLNMGQGSIIAAGLFGVMYLAAQGVVNQTMTVGDFVLVNTFLVQLYVPLNFLGFVYRQIRQSIIDMENMHKLLDEFPEINDSPTASPLIVSRGEVVFDHVLFAYDSRIPILKDVSFTVPAGKTLAIVGASGAGKSTISRLLFRFYDVSGGGIRIDGQDIRNVTQKSLRDTIGMVPQDTVLFNDTLGYNILYAKPDASMDEVRAAARLAQIDTFIAGLPDGYDTMVGERGLKLSGGEKQRVAIARMILKNPPILLFDEATSALDTHTEKEIQRAIREVSRNKTTLVIAHRLSTVVDADNILVLEKGEVIEHGSHAELMRLRGRYASMWERQQEEERQTAHQSEVDFTA